MDILFPTRVGMNRYCGKISLVDDSVPHASGDEPKEKV